MKNHYPTALCAAVCCTLYLHCGDALAQKTDLVYLVNGDRITGEVEYLDRGRMTVKTGALGTVQIKWSSVDRIVSDKSFQIELTAGQRLFGQLPNSDTDGVMIAETDDGPTRIATADIARMDRVRIGRSFWQKLDGKVAMGVSYTKGSEIGQLNFRGNTKYRKVESEYQLNWNSIVTANGAGSDSSRANVGGLYLRFREEKLFWAGLANADRNDRLGINLRVSAGGGIGRILSQRKVSDLAAIAGVVATQENRRGPSGDETNIEGILIGDFAMYQFQAPKTELRSTLTVWPSLTDWGRVRGNLDVSLAQHIFTSDFTLDLSVYASLDSRPPAGASKGDYGIVSSLGYSF